MRYKYKCTIITKPTRQTEINGESEREREWQGQKSKNKRKIMHMKMRGSARVFEIDDRQSIKQRSKIQTKRRLVVSTTSAM